MSEIIYEIGKFDTSRANELKRNFLTENSKDINDLDILYAIDQINRGETAIQINNLLHDIYKSIGIEMGLFEYALIQATLSHLDKKIIPAIYYDKLDDILINLDETSHIKNKTFKPALISGALNPNLVAFMAPEQLHPESWAPIINKIKFKETQENSMATTDLYKCHKCGERRCKVNELQMRGADEATSKVITCLVCYHTFIKS
jgi:transcription elongation factor S-II